MVQENKSTRIVRPSARACVRVVVSPCRRRAVREVEKVFPRALERFTFCFYFSSLYLLEQSGGGLEIALGVCYFVPKQKRPAEVGPLSAAGTHVKKLGSWVNVFSFEAHTALCCGCCLSPFCWSSVGS